VADALGGRGAGVCGGSDSGISKIARAAVDRATAEKSIGRMQRPRQSNTRSAAYPASYACERISA
jgi:hypothetical protein